MSETYDVIVVGCGASGIIAAGRAAELGAKVLLLEKMKQAGRKLRISGKGRCNISNDAPESVYYKNIQPHGRFLKHAFNTFFSKDIVNLLNQHGVPTTTERGKRIFPLSNNAVDVLNGLMKWLDKYDIDILYSTRVEELISDNEGIKGVKARKDGKIINLNAKNVILCTGGKSYPATGSSGDGYTLAKKLGHTISELRPALVPIETEGDMAGKLEDLTLKNVNASVWVNGKKQQQEFGELLFMHFGLSGPIILTLSRTVVDELHKNNKVEISIDLKPALDEKKLDARLLRDLDAHGKKKIVAICRQWMPIKLIPVILRELQIDGNKEGHQMNAKERRSLMHLLKNLKFTATGHRDYNEAIITAGGIITQEIEGKTMQSKLVKNLYFAGEVIDLDGNTGGYNLQIAFSTGWLAGESCCRE